MLISCSYCNKIHDNTIVCNDKQKSLNSHKRKVTKADRYRWTANWQRKRKEINQRDNYLCQVCIRELYDTKIKYNHTGISVHHIISIEDDWSLRDVNDNLICLCSAHHKMAEVGDIEVKVLKSIVKEQEGKLFSKNESPLLC